MKSSLRKTTEGILYTDLYQLTMAQLYYRMGIHERQAKFDHFFRSYPNYGSHMAGYCINAGLGWLLDWMAEARFGEREIEFLSQQRGRAGRRIFADDFLGWMKKRGNFDGITIRAIPEGRVVHPNVPLTVVEGPLVMAQILESPLLNQLNYQILVATKAARIHEASLGQTTIEFGLRRGQDRGAIAGARAALIGGADYTSNTGISCVLGYPPKGTHAHSMVQAFMAQGDSELDAFRAYAEVYPDDCLLLVDTVNTLKSGIPNAITVFEELRRKGHEPLGIRLDSGDLAYLSIQAAKMLSDAGFPETSIVLSNQLDELVIWQIISQITQEASKYGVDVDHMVGRLVFGVGTRLISSEGEPALDGVYKLVALKNGGEWTPAIKISESIRKILNPGMKRTWRIYDTRGKANADLIATAEENPDGMEKILLHHPTEAKTFRILEMKDISGMEPLLVDVMAEGKVVRHMPSIEEMRTLRRSDMERLDPGVKRLVNPHIYHVSLTERLWDLKQEMVQTVKKNIRKNSAR
ncbi:MAG: nicotinate phosphoribosyltransferase [Deltaproteobacteria bacterium]|nr:nicotinate phosphoribosyltransferase [Deltaproteobacteria bacterium]NIS77295.1 nicotinate phosphoribosyltransferase [Deltaproteobacteria bacterium]